MNTGQYYFDHLPNRIKVDFMKNCNLQFNYVMGQNYECLSDMINDAFAPSYTIQGKEYWDHIGTKYQPSLFNKLNILIDRNPNGTALTVMCCGLLMFLIASLAVVKSKNKEREYEQKIKEQDLVNAINLANHITDSSNIVNQTYLPPNWDAMLTKEEVYERMMDTVTVIKKY
jgi:hypothetical protein